METPFSDWLKQCKYFSRRNVELAYQTLTKISAQSAKCVKMLSLNWQGEEWARGFFRSFIAEKVQKRFRNANAK